MRITGFATVALCGFLFITGLPLSASTIDWTYWTIATPSGSAPGTAQGSISGLGITVSYTGEVLYGNRYYPSWMPTTSYVGGTVGNQPPPSGAAINVKGAQGFTDTITFSSPVLNPVLAIWSLGNTLIPSTEARFVFNASEPFTIEASGPSAEYGPFSLSPGVGALYACLDNPNAVCGKEGNGTVQLNGTFTSITWTNPVLESIYGFTVGVNVPEPSTLLLLAGGLLAVGMRSRHKRGR